MATITKTEKIETEIVSDYICNQCQESCKDSSGMNFEGLIDCNIRGGYYSKLGDGTIYNFSLCENCLKLLFSSFSINPKMNDVQDYFYQEEPFSYNEEMTPYNNEYSENNFKDKNHENVAKLRGILYEIFLDENRILPNELSLKVESMLEETKD